MHHAIHSRRLALAQVLALAIVCEGCTPRQLELARDTAPHPHPCNALSYAPDTLRYYLPAIVQLTDDAGAKSGSQRYHVARWRGADVQRQELRESFKLSGGAAGWRQQGDSPQIEMHPLLQTFRILLQRHHTVVAPAASDAPAGATSGHGRAVAHLNDGFSVLEGDAFASVTACDGFPTMR